MDQMTSRSFYLNQNSFDNFIIPNWISNYHRQITIRQYDYVPPILGISELKRYSNSRLDCSPS